jgi:hypothetical protein
VGLEDKDGLAHELLVVGLLHTEVLPNWPCIISTETNTTFASTDYICAKKHQQLRIPY